MEEGLEKEKIKRAILALEDLLVSGIYDYYHGIAGSDEMVKTEKYGFSKYEIKELKNGLQSRI